MRIHKTYNIWATLLNDFSHYQKEEGFERGGEFVPYCDENALINKLNRSEVLKTDAILKGVAFETSLQTGQTEIEIEGQIMKFDSDLVKSMSRITEGSVWQTRVSKSIVLSPAISVNLYGYMDAIKMDTGIDVKTTGSYSFPKFDKSYQHKVYLMGANSMGIHLNKFMYLITDFREYYYEVYPYDPEKFTKDLTIISGDLIDFIESRKELITNENLVTVCELK